MRARKEFGDYQTPAELAEACCRVLVRHGVTPQTIIEPTCGLGTFIEQARRFFPEATRVLGFEINPDYVRAATTAGNAVIRCADFFEIDWTELLGDLPPPVLVIGNPPWVTNSVIGTLGGANLPRKSNLHQHSGIDAVTGKSNFDISEYMMLKLSEALAGRRGTLAMLCKTAVARKVLGYCWKHSLRLDDSHIYPIDAAYSFGAAVSACFLVASFGPAAGEMRCAVHLQLEYASESRSIGWEDGLLVADAALYRARSPLRGVNATVWRSGIKHDCAPVMELAMSDGTLVNGLGEAVDVEPDHLYPMLKSGALRDPLAGARRWMLVPQSTIGEDTSRLETRAPKTWAYLCRHRPHLDKRASSIYRRRPPFSVFGVGPYTFAPWKVAISGLQKTLEFAVVGPREGKPVVFDDAVYFLPCESCEHTNSVVQFLRAPPAQEFLQSLIFWDAKRPITAAVLNQLLIE